MFFFVLFFYGIGFVIMVVLYWQGELCCKELNVDEVGCYVLRVLFFWDELNGLKVESGIFLDDDMQKVVVVLLIVVGDFLLVLLEGQEKEKKILKFIFFLIFFSLVGGRLE